MSFNDVRNRANTLGLELEFVGGEYPVRLFCVDGDSNFDNSYRTIYDAYRDIVSYA